MNHISTQYIRRIRRDYRILTCGIEPAKVKFLVCGTQKGGTTTLDAYLRQHPEICMAKYKEVHYFDHEKFFLYQYPDYRQYHDFFEPKTDQQIWGDNSYLYVLVFHSAQNLGVQSRDEAYYYPSQSDKKGILTLEYATGARF